MIRSTAEEARYSRGKKDCKYCRIDPSCRIVLGEIGLAEGSKEPAEEYAAEKVTVYIH